MHVPPRDRRYPPPRPHPRWRHRHRHRHGGPWFRVFIDLGSILAGTLFDTEPTWPEPEVEDVVIGTSTERIEAAFAPIKSSAWNASAIGDDGFELASVLSMPDGVDPHDVATVRPLVWGGESGSLYTSFDRDSCELSVMGMADRRIGRGEVQLLRLELVMRDGSRIYQDMAVPMKEMI